MIIYSDVRTLVELTAFQMAAASSSLATAYGTLHTQKTEVTNCRITNSSVVLLFGTRDGRLSAPKPPACAFCMRDDWDIYILLFLLFRMGPARFSINEIMFSPFFLSCAWRTLANRGGKES